MKVIVYHSYYGCETGCCGHTVELEDGTSQFYFSHPYKEDFKSFAEELVKEFGEEHVKDLDGKIVKYWMIKMSKDKINKVCDMAKSLLWEASTPEQRGKYLDMARRNVEWDEQLTEKSKDEE
jgi:hypothetical protein